MTVLETRGVVKNFGTLRAVNHVSIKLEKGEIHALLGENGAGKTAFSYSSIWMNITTTCGRQCGGGLQTRKE